MPDLSVSLSGYAIDLEADEDGRLIATSTDFPELATDGADIQEALANAEAALEVVIRERQRRGEAVAPPRGPR